MSLVLWCDCISHRDMQLVYTLLFSLYSIPLSIPFTGYTSPLHRLYYLYLFALSTNTQAQELYVCTIHTSTWTLSTFLVDINTVTINAHCTIGSDLSCICKHPTSCEHVLPMCMWFMYVCLWVKCTVKATGWPTFPSGLIKYPSIYLSIYLSIAPGL